MSEPRGKIFNQTGIPREKEFDFWEPVIFTKEDIDNEIERLADPDQPKNSFRSSILAHPRAEKSSLGLAPGIRVSLDVLRPGEQSHLFRHNATEVNFCIKGSGYTEIAGKKIKYGQYHVVNHPSYTAYRHVNDTDQVQARLTYSEGEGRSTVEGKVYEWKAGDLMLSAPGWATHNHASYDEYVYELTMQDQPLHLFMESLI